MEVEQFREAVSQSKVEMFGKSKPHEVSQKPQLGVHLERRHSKGNLINLRKGSKLLVYFPLSNLISFL